MRFGKSGLVPLLFLAVLSPDFLSVLLMIPWVLVTVYFLLTIAWVLVTVYFLLTIPWVLVTVYFLSTSC